jgi:diacylglycerol kinase
MRSFGYAGTGIVQLILHQRNAQIHLFVTLVLCGVSVFWGLSRMEWIVLVLTITLVLAMEAMNTALEALVDLAAPDYHPLAKRAKDIAAGAVLLAALGAAVVALLLYGPRIIALARWLAG